METKFKNTRRNVLVVDDEYINRQLLGNVLLEEYNIIYAENGKEALDIIKENKNIISLVMLDIMMPVMNGLELLEYLKADDELKHIPVIVLTSDVSAELQSLKLGAADFIKKPYDMPEIIKARTKRIIELSKDTIIIQSTERDALTGLYMKQYFFEYSGQLERFHSGKEMDAIFIRIKRLYLVNELYGREYAQKIIQHVSNSLKTLLTKIDGIACKDGEDSFFIYCVHRENIQDLISKLNSELEDMVGNSNICLTAGIYPKVDMNMSIEWRFEKAKLAAATVYSSYTQNIAYYDKKLYERDLYYERLIHDMQSAIENHDFKIYLQPKYYIDTDDKPPYLCSAEALVRWNHPELGMISPGDFIPLFEENGLIQILDQYVWNETGKLIKKWKDKYGSSVPVSINVSRVDLYDPNIETKLVEILKENNISVKDILLEITETVYDEDIRHMLKIIESLRLHGFKIEMDDFGSGYSSLNMLNEIPIDAIKLDMKFIKNVHTDSKSLRLVQLVIDIAKNLGVTLVAEGVEFEEQYKLLKQMKCDIVQGYYFSKPLAPDEFEKLIEK